MRLPGESVREEIERVREAAIDDNLTFVFAALAMTIATGLMWALGTPPRVAFFGSVLLLLVSIIYAVPRIQRARRKLRALRLGNVGERAVAEYLDTLRDHDTVRVLHDIEGDGFNLDHVVVGLHGIFVIETKTISKPEGRDTRIIFDGERVRIGGFEPDRNPVAQAAAASGWLRRLLEETLRRQYPIRPVVFFPGWFVERTQEASGSRVWVLEPKAFGSFMRREPMVLREKEVLEVTNFLKRYVRASPSR